jgi:hypothetical protein
MYLYGFNGSKDILYSKAKITNNKVVFKVDKKYTGMMRAFFQKTNSSVNLVSENKNIDFKVDLDNKNKFSNVVFNDQTNQFLGMKLTSKKNRNLILPALIQIKDYYRPTEDFYKSLEKEINLLSKTINYSMRLIPFLDYYHKIKNFLYRKKQLS